jgi:hypothetical protein
MSSSDRRPYLTATVLNQALLDACHDNLECRLEMICEIDTPIGTIYASDRNKYVGGRFYEALLVFPTINRTVGEWLSNELQFSTLTLELSNVDERFNNFLPSGADYGGWVGRQVVVKVGLAEQASTYTTIFKGTVTSVGGFKRTVKSIVVVSRDNFDRVNAKFPNTAITSTVYPKCEQKNLGKIIPYIYGDWTVELDPYPAAVPAIVVNGSDPMVNFKEKVVVISGANLNTTAHGLDDDDKIQLDTSGSLPAPFSTGTTYYVVNATADNFELSLTMGGVSISSGGPQSGVHQFFPDPSSSRRDVSLIVSDNANTSFNSNGVYLKRGEIFSPVPSSELVGPGGTLNYFSVKQTGLWVDDGAGGTVAFEYDMADEFYCQVQGKDLSGFESNPVAQAKDLLKTFGGLVDADFDASWATYQAKNTPAQSNIAGIYTRIWVGEQNGTLAYVLSLFEQIRLEAFIDRNLKLKINALHFEDWDATPSYTVKNWDIEKESLRTNIDDRNNFNRAQGVFAYLPIVNENARATGIYRNQASITQTGQAISKKIVFPNMYVEAQVEYQLIEVLRLASAIIEIFELNLTWRALLLDIGNFVALNIDIASVQMTAVPAMIREIGYNPEGLKLPIKIWSFQMVPFESWNPGYAGITGGQSSIIIKE